MKSNKMIPKKNYLILLTIILCLAVFSFMVVKLYYNYQAKKISTSYLSRVIGEVQYDELENVFLEQGSINFLYISYTNSGKIYDLEVKLKKIIIDKNLQDNMVYFNATDLMNDKLDKLNEKLNLTNKKIISLPAIIYYRDNQVIDLITSGDNSILNDGDFVQLLDKYEIEGWLHSDSQNLTRRPFYGMIYIPMGVGIYLILTNYCWLFLMGDDR